MNTEKLTGKVIVITGAASGMDIVIVTTAKTNEEAYDLLKELGVPFRK